MPQAVTISPPPFSACSFSGLTFIQPTRERSPQAATNPVAKLNPFKHSKVCPTLDGKPFCDLSENDKSLLGKKVKHVKATCTDTGKVDGPEGC